MPIGSADWGRQDAYWLSGLGSTRCLLTQRIGVDKMPIGSADWCRLESAVGHWQTISQTSEASVFNIYIVMAYVVMAYFAKSEASVFQRRFADMMVRYDS